MNWFQRIEYHAMRWLAIISTATAPLRGAMAMDLHVSPYLLPFFLIAGLGCSISFGFYVYKITRLPLNGRGTVR